jgi:uncharacterized protein YndB with AHSA1/START domain
MANGTASDMTKEKIEIEYEIKSSVGILYSRISTAMGLAEWFAENVDRNENTFTFTWEGNEEEALLIEHKEPEYMRWHWVNDDEDETYFEMRIRIDPVTEDVALLITDFCDADEKEESVSLWNKQIEKLKRVIGSY